MGLQQGEAASFKWRWHYSAARLAIWLVLILALVIPKANRDIRILLILVPLVIVNLLCSFKTGIYEKTSQKMEKTLRFLDICVLLYSWHE